MGRLALSHRGRAVVLPPLALLEPFVDRTPNHWYWLDEFYDDGLDRSAIFLWTPPAEVRVKFMVPRLLWQLTNPTQLHRVLLENTCGLFTCINPAHWRDRKAAVQIPARIVLPDTVDAIPVVRPNTRVNVHIVRGAHATTLCGILDVKCLKPDKKTPITCDECITIWVRLAQPFTEVK